MNKKNILIILIVSLFLLVLGVTYAYFTAEITGRETTSTIIVNGGEMSIVYDNLSNTITLENIYPREEAWVTKNFTVTGTNTTDLNMKYKVGLDISDNTFPAGYLTYSLENTNSDSGTPIANKTGRPIPTSGTEWFGEGLFVTGRNQIHAYTLKIYFPDNNVNQNAAQESILTAKVTIEEAGTREILLGKHATATEPTFTINYSACVAKYTEMFDGTIPADAQEGVESMCTTGEYDGRTLEEDITNPLGFNMTLEEAQTAGIISNLRQEPVQNVEHTAVDSYNINYSGCISKFTEYYGGAIPSEDLERVESLCTTGEYNGFTLEAYITDDFNMSLEEAQTAGIISNLTYKTWMGPPVGTIYIDGQYIYKYMSNYLDYEIDKDGWSVYLIDPSSTDPVTTELCRTINGKPIIYMSNMFSRSKASSIDLSSFDTSSVFSMNYMFGSSQATILDLSTFDTSSVTDMKEMFSGSNVRVIYARTTADANKMCNANPVSPEDQTKKIPVYVNNELVCEVSSHYSQY